MSRNIKFLLALGFIIFLVIYGMFDPEASSFFPKCPFLSLTGYQCAGCGSQRAVHQLLHGNIVGAFHYNQLLVISLPYIATGLVFELPPFKSKYLKLQRILFGYKTVYIITIIIFTFMILRNVL